MQRCRPKTYTDTAVLMRGILEMQSARHQIIHPLIMGTYSRNTQLGDLSSYEHIPGRYVLNDAIMVWYPGTAIVYTVCCSPNMVHYHDVLIDGKIQHI